MARDKLRSAEILLEQQCYAGGLEILAMTLLTLATAVSGEKQIPTLEKATIWLYSEVLPKQWMTEEQVNSIVKVIALSQNLDVPEALIDQMLLETQSLMGQYENNTEI